MVGTRYEMAVGTVWYEIGAHLLRSRLRTLGHDVKKAERAMASGEEFQMSEFVRVRQRPKWRKPSVKKKAKRKK